MSILVLLVVLIALAMIVGAIQKWAPGDPMFKNLACLAIVIVAALALLAAVGAIPRTLHW